MIGLLTIGCYLWQQSSQQSTADVVFKTLKGQTIPLAELSGKPVLVTFWATDCPSCIAEIPHLISLHQQFSATGLTIIAVNMNYDPPNRVLTMATEKQLPYSVALDVDGQLALAFGKVTLTPTSFLIDRQGKIKWQTTGSFDLSVLERMIAQL